MTELGNLQKVGARAARPHESQVDYRPKTVINAGRFLGLE